MQQQSGILFSRIAKAMLHHFSSHQRADEVSKFFRENAFDGSEVRAVDQAVEVRKFLYLLCDFELNFLFVIFLFKTIRINADVLSRDLDSLTAYFQKL